jgi:hypothetical protein
MLQRPGTKHAATLVDAMRTKNVRTKNGALTNETSLNSVLDMFFLAGASRKMTEREIINIVVKAYGHDKSLTLKCLFWARDVRGGAGERRFFRLAWRYLLNTYPKDVKHLVPIIPEYGRWDDLFYDATILQHAMPTIQVGLAQKNNLLAKWLPRKGDMAWKIRENLHLSPKSYRKTIVALSNTVEQQMCRNEWNNINYPHVPSIAMNKYRRAFYRNDETRFTSYINDVTKGKEKINASTLFPHDLVRALYNNGNREAIQAQWNALPDYMEGSTERLLPICDLSGSMMGTPMDVALALGIYISERNVGVYKNAFMTFSAKPELHVLEGTLYQKLAQMNGANAGYNTNLVSSFNLILETAVKNKIPQSQMPTKVLVISDMEFDGTSAYQSHLQKAASERFLTNYERIESHYRQAGYTMPSLIFWNVNGRQQNVPATTNNKVGLVSGFSPSILKSILAGAIYSPIDLMLRTIESDRYSDIGSKN